MRVNYLNDDRDVISSLQKGEEGAFCILFCRYYPSLCVFGTGITNNSGASEHIAADAFMKLWERRSNFAQVVAIKSFLYTIVRNASIDWVRKTQTDKHSATFLIDSIPQLEKTSLELLITAEIYRQLHSAINTLPTQCRDVITLSFIEGKKLKEVATELNIAVGTVKSQKSRGLTLLKKHLRALHTFFF